jgi:hypothetical protein
VSGKNNVNPDHYKTAGRDRQGEDLVGTPRPETTGSAPRRRKKKGDGPPPNLIPGAPPIGERPKSDESED